jgi:hypothetical protein
MKTNELQGEQLDFWVAKAEGVTLLREMPPRLAGIWDRHVCDYESYSPSTDWSQGGPIIERARIETQFDHELFMEDSKAHESYLWEAWHMDISAVTHFKATSQHGSTPLQAAMRCFVASKFGESVDDSQAD